MYWQQSDGDEMGHDTGQDMSIEQMMIGSAHSTVVGALEDKDLHGVVVIDGGALDLQHKDLSDVVLGRHRTLVGHVLLQLQVHEELRIGLAVHEVLGDDIVGLVAETFVGNSLDLQGEVEVAHVLEGDGWHTDLVLLRGDLDDWSVLIWLVEVLDADDLRHLALGIDGETDGLQALELHLQETLNHIVIPHWRDLDRHLNLRSLFLSDLEPHLLEVLEPLVAPDREDVLIEVVKLRVVALGNDPEHEGVGAIILNDLILEPDRDIKLFNRTRKQGGLAEHDVGSVDLNKVFGLGEFSCVLFALHLGRLLRRRGRCFLYLEVLHHLVNGRLFFLRSGCVSPNLREGCSGPGCSAAVQESAGLSLIARQNQKFLNTIQLTSSVISCCVDISASQQQHEDRVCSKGGENMKWDCCSYIDLYKQCRSIKKCSRTTSGCVTPPSKRESRSGITDITTCTIALPMDSRDLR